VPLRHSNVRVCRQPEAITESRPGRARICRILRGAAYSSVRSLSAGNRSNKSQKRANRTATRSRRENLDHVSRHSERCRFLPAEIGALPATFSERCNRDFKHVSYCCNREPTTALEKCANVRVSVPCSSLSLCVASRRIIKFNVNSSSE